jgi:riboflavin kinase/FMN adenylyltransferase
VAKLNKMDSVVVTMQPLASQYFQTKFKVAIITPFKSKYGLIKELNVDVFCLLNFNKNVASLSAQDFINEILIKGLNAKYIIVGDDFKFGKSRKGDYDYLKKYCEPNGIQVENINTINHINSRISSSKVRQALNNGDFELAESLLGRQYCISGKVSKGKQLGRTLNFPTINIKLKNYKASVTGVFCVSLIMQDGSIEYGSANLGTRPTVNGEGEILEVYILDFDKDIYGQFVKVLFHHKIRNEVKFDTLDQLKLKIEEDVRFTRNYFLKSL